MIIIQGYTNELPKWHLRSMIFMDSDPSWPTQPKMDWSILNPSLIYCQEWKQQFCLSSILPLYLLKSYKFSWWVKLVSRVRAYPPVQLDSSYVISILNRQKRSCLLARYHTFCRYIICCDDILRFGVWDWVCRLHMAFFRP